MKFWKAPCALTLREPRGNGLSLGLGGKVNSTALGIVNCLALFGAVQTKDAPTIGASVPEIEDPLICTVPLESPPVHVMS